MKYKVSWLSTITTMVAIVLSWTINQSVWWAILHSMVSGIYIPYWFIKYTNICQKILEWSSQ